MNGEAGVSDESLRALRRGFRERRIGASEPREQAVSDRPRGNGERERGSSARSYTVKPGDAVVVSRLAKVKSVEFKGRYGVVGIRLEPDVPIILAEHLASALVAAYTGVEYVFGTTEAERPGMRLVA